MTMTRSAGLAFTFACSTLVLWLIAQIPRDTLSGVDAITVWNVTLVTQLTLFSAFIAAALITHLHPVGMSRGKRAAWRAGAFMLAIAAAVLAPQIVVIAAAGYVVFVLANDVRQRKQRRVEEPA